MLFLSSFVGNVEPSIQSAQSTVSLYVLGSKGVHDPYVVHIAQMQHSLSFVISAADIS